MDEQTSSLKVLLLGDSGVGKTCLRSQFIHHIFSNAYRATIGGDYLTTTVSTSTKEKVILQVWDTAGQERFNSISNSFYRGTDVAILVFDLTNFESFDNLRNWLKRFLDNCFVSRPGIMIVGNKSDKDVLRKISARQAVEFASDLDVGLIDNIDLDVLETSAKVHEDVQKLFIRAAELGISRVDDNHTHQMMSFDNIDISEMNQGLSRSSCC